MREDIQAAVAIGIGFVLFALAGYLTDLAGTIVSLIGGLLLIAGAYVMWKFAQRVGGSARVAVGVALGLAFIVFILNRFFLRDPDPQSLDEARTLLYVGVANDVLINAIALLALFFVTVFVERALVALGLAATALTGFYFISVFEGVVGGTADIAQLDVLIQISALAGNLPVAAGAFLAAWRLTSETAPLPPFQEPVPPQQQPP